MKKVFYVISIFMLIIVLVGCGDLSLFDQENESFLDLEESKQPEEFIMDYFALGFTKSFDDPVDIYTFLNRDDGSIDPYSKLSVNILIPNYRDELPFLKEEHELDKSSDNPYIYYDPFYVYFDTNIYTHYRRGAVSKEGFYYADIQMVDGKFRLRFFSDGFEPYNNLNARPYPFIDAIESNGVYSYVINKTYMDRNNNRNIKEYLFNLFYVIYHDETLPYIVYFSETYIFLISKDERFDKTCMDIFEQSKGIHLFKK